MSNGWSTGVWGSHIIGVRKNKETQAARGKWCRTNEPDVWQEDVDAFFIGDSSPALGSQIAQDVLEPILRAQSEQLGGDLRFGTELVAFEQDEDGITATIRERESSSTRTVRAQFLVAAD